MSHDWALGASLQLTGEADFWHPTGFPPLVAGPHQRAGRVAAVVGQRGDQPVGIGDAAAVGAGDGHLGFDDPHRQAALQAGQVGAVGQVGQDQGLRLDFARASSTAPVASTAARKAAASKARSSKISIVGAEYTVRAGQEPPDTSPDESPS
jgi:hypothetical protein